MMGIIYLVLCLLQAGLTTVTLGVCLKKIKSGERRDKTALCLLSALLCAGFAVAGSGTVKNAVLGGALCLAASVAYSVCAAKRPTAYALTLPLLLCACELCVKLSLFGLAGSSLVSIFPHVRLIALTMALAVNISLFQIIKKLYTGELKRLGTVDNVVFILVTVCTVAAVICMMLVICISSFNENITFIAVLTAAVAVAVTVSVSEVLTSFLRRRGDVDFSSFGDICKTDAVKTREQIDRLAKIRHEMNNRLLCIQHLLSENRADEAKRLCDRLLLDLKTTYTPVATSNVILNAIVNVELKKAASAGIHTAVEIKDDMNGFKCNSDLISIIGNLCDNAIEYLIELPVKQRKMRLIITKNGDYNVITCKNVICGSVLSENPGLQTNKSDSMLHGRGRRILKDISAKYDGSLSTVEKDGVFSSSVIIKIPQISKSA